MALARYKYAAQTLQEASHEIILPEDTWEVRKYLEGTIGIVFHIRCTYAAGAGSGLAVRVLQGIDAALPGDSPEAAAISFELPLTGTDACVTIPVLLPEVGPAISLQLVNSTGAFVTVSIYSRIIEGVEVQ